MPNRGARRYPAFLLPAILLGAWGVLLPTEAAAQTPEPQACVDINTASSQQLQRIVHVGPARTAQIISLREERAFRSVDELVRVSGIAAARLRDIKEQGLACVRSRAPGDTTAVAPPPQTRQAPPPRPPTQRRACCRVCTTGKACGNSCIARNLTCRQPPGCACNGEEVSFRELLMVPGGEGPWAQACNASAWGGG